MSGGYIGAFSLSYTKLSYLNLHPLEAIAHLIRDQILQILRFKHSLYSQSQLANKMTITNVVELSGEANKIEDV